MKLVMYVNGQRYADTRIQYVGITTATAKEEYFRSVATELLKKNAKYFSGVKMELNIEFFVEGVKSKMNSMSMEEIEKMIA